MGSWSRNLLFFVQNKDFLFFSVCRSASKECHLERSENKATNKGNSSISFLRKSFDCVLNIDPCLSCSTS